MIVSKGGVEMGFSVTEEYTALLEKKRALEIELRSLPKGYISKKTIRGNVQHYLQRREGSRIVGTYIRNDEAEAVQKKIERRKEIAMALPAIDARLATLEQAARLIGNDLFCRLMLFKLSAGMDELGSDEKERCASFGEAMNAIEGVPVSRETGEDIDAWKRGDISFISVFETALKRYGFPVEEAQ